MPRKAVRKPVERVRTGKPRYYRNRQDWIVRLAVGLATGEKDSKDLKDAQETDLNDAREFLKRIECQIP